MTSLSFRAGALDFLCGCAVLALLVGLTLLGLLASNDLRQGAIAIFAFLFATGFLRSNSRKNPWMTGCVVAFGLIAPVLGIHLAGVAMHNAAFVATFSVISPIAALSGAHVRQFLVRARPTRALLLGLASAGFAGVVAGVVV